MRVNLTRDDGKSVKAMVHVLVLMAWVGPRPSPRHHGAHCHSNCKKDNRLSNLAWKLPEENEADKKTHGTAPKGGWSKRPSSAQVERIRQRAAAGESFTKIGRDEKLHRSSISRIVKGLRRKSVERDLHKEVETKSEEVHALLAELLEQRLSDPGSHEKICSLGANYLKDYLNRVMDEQDLLLDMKIDTMLPTLRRIFEVVPFTPNSAFHVLFEMWTRVRGSMEDKHWLVEALVKDLKLGAK